MKITIYELLGMIKDGKAPKGVKSEGHYYTYNELEKDYYEGMGYDYEYLIKNTPNDRLNDEVEILEEEKKNNFTGWKMYQDGKEVCSMDCSVEEKKIPEKIDVINWDKCIHNVTHKEKELAIEIYKTQKLLNQLVDYLKSKGE